MSKFIKITSVQYEDGVDASCFPNMMFVDVASDASDGDIDHACEETISTMTGHCSDGYIWEIMHANDKTLSDACSALVTEIREWDSSESFKDELEAAEDQLYAFNHGQLKRKTILSKLQSLVEVLEQFKPERTDVLNLGHTILHLFDDENRSGLSPITYKQLKNLLDQLSAEQLNQNVTIMNQGEFFGAVHFVMTSDNSDSDVVEPGTLVLGTISQQEG